MTPHEFGAFSIAKASRGFREGNKAPAEIHQARQGDGAIVVIWNTGRVSVHGDDYRAQLVLDRQDIARLFIEAFSGIPTGEMLKIIRDADQEPRA